MKVEIRKNGKLQVRLTPADAIETVAVDSIIARAAKGEAVRVTGEDGVLVVEVEG